MTKKSAEKYSDEINQILKSFKKNLKENQYNKILNSYRYRLEERIEEELDIVMPHGIRIIDLERMAEANDIDTVIFFRDFLMEKLEEIDQ